MGFDVAIVGAGFAGSLAASMLAKSGHSVAVIDPHEVYPPDFRCEKVDGHQFETLRRTGLIDPLLRIATYTDRVWIATFGRLIDIEPFVHYGFRYEDLVNTFRDAIPASVVRVRGKVRRIDPGETPRRVVLWDGTEIEARLVVLATGLQRSLLRSLGIEREGVIPNYSMCVGFDIEPSKASEFGFPAVQYNWEFRSDKFGYLSLFRIGASMRGNLFLYHAIDSPVIADFRARPMEALNALLPNLGRLIGEFGIVGPVRIRPTQLELPRAVALPGIAMIGDAYFTPCPAAGMGVLKAITDAERLCHGYASRWLAADGAIAPAQIAEFYDDPVKTACDASAIAKARWLKRLATDRSLRSEAERLARFASRLRRGWVRRLTTNAAFPKSEHMLKISARQQ